MQRSDPTFRHEALSAEEVDSFLDELLDELFASLTDNDTINSDTDKVPDLGRVDP